MKLRELSEDGFIRKIRERFKTPSAVVGIGDDAAILDIPEGHSLVYCSDLVAEGTHFVRGLHPADSIGYKAVAVNVSDVGAMGGAPMCFLISAAFPPDLDMDWVDGFLDGVERACHDFDVSLVGGDSSSASSIFVDVSIIGRVLRGRAVLRSGAQVGDAIYVTGRLGGSALGLERLKAGAAMDDSIQRHLYPTPRHRVGAAAAKMAHAMIDISDGLSTDLRHILEESKVSARIYKDALPGFPGASSSQVLHGGEEYELVIAAPSLPGEIDGVPITRIGEIIADPKGDLLLAAAGQESSLKAGGYRHFS